MIGLDTNVLLRAVTQDDPVRTPIARALIGELDESNPGYINTVVLAELCWSLRTRFKYERLAIIGAIEALLESVAFVVSDRDAVNAAVSRSRDDGLHFVDALIGELNHVAGCQTTLTFDILAAKQARFTQAEGSL